MDRPESTPDLAGVCTSDPLGLCFRTLARTVPGGVILLDASGVPVFSNETAKELLGLPALESGAPTLERLGEVVPRSLRQSPTSESAVVDVPGVAGSTRHVLLRSIPLDDGETGSLVLVEDRTRMAALEASLVLASRLQTQSLLRSQVHDLKAPLNALAIHVELLRKSLEEEEDKADEARDKQVGTTQLLEREIKRLGRSLEALMQDTDRRKSPRGARRLDVRQPVRETTRLARGPAKSAGIRLRRSSRRSASKPSRTPTCSSRRSSTWC